MFRIKMTLSRYFSDEPQRGIVECEMGDVYGTRWLFFDKTAVVSSKNLDANTTYPTTIEIAVEVATRFQDARLGDVVRIDTDRPWGIESAEGETRFDVFPVSLVKL